MVDSDWPEDGSNYLASQPNWALQIDNCETRCHQLVLNVSSSASRVGSSCYLLDYVCLGYTGSHRRCHRYLAGESFRQSSNARGLHRCATSATIRYIPIVESVELESTDDRFRVGQSLLHLPPLGLTDRDAKSCLKAHVELSEYISLPRNGQNNLSVLLIPHAGTCGAKLHDRVSGAPRGFSLSGAVVELRWLCRVVRKENLRFALSHNWPATSEQYVQRCARAPVRADRAVNFLWSVKLN